MKKITCVLPVLTGFLSYLLIKDNLEIYDTVTKPSFAPPAKILLIVYAVLYLLMGISAYIVLRDKTESKKPAINLYLLTLIFNFIWSPIFFNRRQLGMSLFVLIIIWLLALASIYIYHGTSRAASCLQIPYLIWITAACILNLYMLIRQGLPL